MTHSDRITSKLAQVRELAEKATPGKWTSGAEALFAYVDGPSIKIQGVAENAGWDCAFIATSRDLVPALLKALEHALDTQRMLSEVHLAKSFNPAAFIAHRNAELADLLDGKRGGE